VAADPARKPVVLIFLRGEQNVHAMTLPHHMAARQVDNAAGELANLRQQQGAIHVWQVEVEQDEGGRRRVR